MSEVDTQAALAELQGAGEEESQATEPQQAETEVEYYDLPYNGQTIKLPLNHEIPLYHNGATQNIPLSKLFNGYRNSAHLEAKQKEFKEKITTMEPEYEEFQKYKDKLYGLQKWSEENPNDFQALWDLYENRQAHLLSGQANPETAPTQLPPDHPLIKQVAELSEKFKSTEEKLSQYEQREQEALDQAQVDEVHQEIEEFSKEFPGVKLDELDPEGISLKSRIIQFGAENSYPNFRAAALSFQYADGTSLLNRLVETVKSEGRNEAVKAVKQDNANGILSRSSTPAGQGKTVDVRRLSDDDRRDLALEEFSGLLGEGGFNPQRS